MNIKLKETTEPTLFKYVYFKSEEKNKLLNVEIKRFFLHSDIHSLHVAIYDFEFSLVNFVTVFLHVWSISSVFLSSIAFCFPTAVNFPTCMALSNQTLQRFFSSVHLLHG